MRTINVDELKQNMRDPHTIDPSMRNCYQYMKEILIISPSAAAYRMTSKELKDNDAFIMDVIYSNDEIVRFMEDRHDDPKLAIELLCLRSCTIRYFKSLLSCKEFVLQNILAYPYIVRFVSNDLKRSIDIALACQSPFALRDLDESMRDNPEVVDHFLSLRGGGSAYQWFSQRMKDNRDIVLGAISSWAFALSFATKFQKDETVVLEAIRVTKYADTYSKLDSHRTIYILLREWDGVAEEELNWHILRYPELRKYRTYDVIRKTETKPYILELKALPNAVDYFEAKERYAVNIELHTK